MKKYYYAAFTAFVVAASFVVCSCSDKLPGESEVSVSATASSANEKGQSEETQESSVKKTQPENPETAVDQTTIIETYTENDQVTTAESDQETTIESLTETSIENTPEATDPIPSETEITEPVVNSGRLSEEEYMELLEQVYPDRTADEIVQFNIAVYGDCSEYMKQDAESFSAGRTEARKYKISQYQEQMAYADKGLVDDNSAQIRKELTDMIKDFPAMTPAQEEAFLTEYAALRERRTYDSGDETGPAAVRIIACYYKNVGLGDKLIQVIIHAESKSLFPDTDWTDITEYKTYGSHLPLDDDSVAYDNDYPYTGKIVLSTGEVSANRIMDVLNEDADLRISSINKSGFAPFEWALEYIYPHTAAAWNYYYRGYVIGEREGITYISPKAEPM